MLHFSSLRPSSVSTWYPPTSPQSWKLTHRKYSSFHSFALQTRSETHRLFHTICTPTRFQVPPILCLQNFHQVLPCGHRSNGVWYILLGSLESHPSKSLEIRACACKRDIVGWYSGVSGMDRSPSAFNLHHEADPKL